MTILAEIRQQLDESGGAVFWVDEQLHDAVNEAILDVFASTRHEYGTATITFTASNPDVALPATIWLPQYIIGTKGRYYPTTGAKLEQYNRTWKSDATGYPKHFVLNDLFSLMAYPVPDAAYTFVVSGVPWPTCGEIADGNENITVNKKLREAIIHRAVSSLLEYTQPTLSEVCLKAAMQKESEFKIQLRNRQSHNIRALRPGTLFSKAQSGVVELGRRYK